MKDRVFWAIIRRALLAVVAAIDQRFGLGKFAKGKTIEKSEGETISGIYSSK